MSPPTDDVCLILQASVDFPRMLRLTWTSGFGLSVWMSTRGGLSPLAYATTAIADCRLDLFHEKWSLWLGSAAFNLSADEKRQALDTFGPIGLKVRSAFPSSAVSSLSADSQAAPSYQPPGDARGMSPVFVCTDTGESDLDDATAARGLTHHEGY